LLVYDNLIKKGKHIFVLIDPEKEDRKTLKNKVEKIDVSSISAVLIGGSAKSIEGFNNFVKQMKEYTDKPVILFPGSASQISPYADGVLFLTLISGRNPDFLIGEQVKAAPILKEYGIEIIPTGYILVKCGKTTSVEKVSKTDAIDADEIAKIIAHSIAGEMLGLKVIYLEGGSGADKSIPDDIVEGVRENINIPLFIGGGIRDVEDIERKFDAGADVVVIGNAIENDDNFLGEMERRFH